MGVSSMRAVVFMGIAILVNAAVVVGGQEPCNIEAFGKVVVFDPAQQEAIPVGRTKSFPADALSPSKELTPATDGTYAVAAGPSCVGLEWSEPRLLVTVGFEAAKAADIPLGEKAVLEVWAGQSKWQGKWEPAKAQAKQDGARRTWQFDEGGKIAEKIRWVFPAGAAIASLKSFNATTDAHWEMADILIQSERPAGGKAIPIEIYNGFIVEAPAGNLATACKWDDAKPLRMKVRYAAGGKYATNRTVLRFGLADRPFGVAVDDVLANDCVYLPHAGAFVTRAPAPVTLEQYREQIADRQTVLGRVRAAPDQSFSQAMEKVHNPVQDRGPMMLCLACDNRKFIANEDGSINFRLYDMPDAKYEVIATKAKADSPATDYCRLVPQFGPGKIAKKDRRLDGGWLPMPMSDFEAGGVIYHQRTYVAPVDDGPPQDGPSWVRRRAMCVVEYTVSNTGKQNADASLALTLTESTKTNTPLEIGRLDGAPDGQAERRVGSFVDLSGAGALAAKVEAGHVSLAGSLPPGGAARMCVYLPAWQAVAKDRDVLAGEADWAAKCRKYWTAIMAPAMQIELPDALLSDAIRASQVHCMLAARTQDKGATVAPWIASDRYESAIDSEGHAVVRGMDMMGHRDFTRRSLDFFLNRYSPDGFMSTGYVLTGTGEDLWTLAQYTARSGDTAWLRANAPKIIAACRWIVAQRGKTKRLDATGHKVPEYGLAPPGVSADWNRFAYRFFNDAQYCAGLREAAAALAAINAPEAAGLAAEAADYQRDLLAAYRWAQGCSPALPLDDGTWIPACPTILDCFGHPGTFYPGEDGQRSWCYAVELGPHHLAATGVLDLQSAEAGRMADQLEDVEFLRAGRDYPEESNHKDPFNFGGFSKLQPYYTRVAEIYAQRDDVKPFIRSYFNAIPSLLSRENLSFWEHFHNTGAWNKTHETGWFLCQSRLMLVMERGDDLWLAPFVTTHWMKDGMKVAVRNAPTRFGPVSYSITSAVASGKIEAVVEPPTRSAPAHIVIRLRHPDGKRISSVTVNGKEHSDFDPKGETVTLKPTRDAIHVVAEYR